MLQKTKVLAALTLLLLPAGVLAQDTATGDAEVTIEELAITLTPIDLLSFGTVLAFGRDGSVTVSPGGQTTADQAHVSLPGAPGIFLVTGVPSAPFSVSLPTDNSVTVTAGANSMTLRSFTREGGSTQLLLDSLGERTFTVGATLNVTARQPAGFYTGQYDVTVDYN